MKYFLNDPEMAVDEALEGFLAVHGNLVHRLDTARVVVRNDIPRGKVGIVSGGGSGHKPAFIGFVGDGMLDAVAAGDIFSAPTAASALEAIRAADTGAGVLFLLGNYSGDVMNFTMAAEQARAEGRKVELSISTDDCGSGFKDDPSQRRGVVGSVLIWKVCGAASRNGASLQELKALADAVNSQCRTTGVALTTCAVPAIGRPTFTLAEDEMELGVGLHGDRGVHTAKLEPADAVVDMMTKELVEDLPFNRNDKVVSVINGMGATPLIELYVAQRRLRQNLDGLGIQTARAYVGEYITALDSAGLSITLLRVDAKVAALIDAPANAPHFVQC